MRFLILLAFIVSSSSFSLVVLSSAGRREKLKDEILQLAKATNRGANATPEQETRMKDLFEKLENLNPTSKPLKSKLVNGDWYLEYTTSSSVNGKGGYPRFGPIVQKIDTDSLSAENSEVVDYFGVIKVPRKVTATLSPQNGRVTNVQFKRFSVGPLGFDAPENFKGYLDVTYLDDNIRLTRGDKGNIFVLSRML